VKKTRQYEVYEGSRRILRTKVHAKAHEYLSKQINSSFEFYFVCCNREHLLACSRFFELTGRRLNVLISYNFIRDRYLTQVLQQVRPHLSKVMIDSGAFHVLIRKVPLEKFQSYIGEYVNWLNNHTELYDYCVAPDVPCDERPAEKIQKLPNRYKIELTIANTVHWIDRLTDPRKAVAVVQGYFVNEYLLCAEKLKELGLTTAKTGVGSLCVRKYSRQQAREVPQILASIRQVLPSWVKLHAFGLQLDFLPTCLKYLHSSDSASWQLSYSKFNRIRIANLSTGQTVELDLVSHGGARKKNLDQVTIYTYNLLAYWNRVQQLTRQAAQTK